MEKTKKELALNKGSEKYIFRYDEGNEGDLLDALVAQANDPRSEFDWFDAALLSFKLIQSLIGQADQILCDEFPDIMTKIVEDNDVDEQVREYGEPQDPQTKNQMV